jgi:hypothetical protein
MNGAVVAMSSSVRVLRGRFCPNFFTDDRQTRQVDVRQRTDA